MQVHRGWLPFFSESCSCQQFLTPLPDWLMVLSAVHLFFLQTGRSSSHCRAWQLGVFQSFMVFVKWNKRRTFIKKLAKWCKSREKDVLVFVMLVLCRLLVQIWDSSLVPVPSQEKYQLSQLYLVRKMLIIIRENPVGLPNSECVSFSFCFSCLYNFPKPQDMERRSG